MPQKKPKPRGAARAMKKPQPEEAPAMRPEDYPEEMDPEQAARYLKVSGKTLLDWTKAKKLPFSQLSKNKRTYLKADLDELKRRSRQVPADWERAAPAS